MHATYTRRSNPRARSPRRPQQPHGTDVRAPLTSPAAAARGLCRSSAARRRAPPRAASAASRRGSPAATRGPRAARFRRRRTVTCAAGESGLDLAKVSLGCSDSNLAKVSLRCSGTHKYLEGTMAFGYRPDRDRSSMRARAHCARSARSRSSCRARWWTRSARARLSALRRESAAARLSDASSLARSSATSPLTCVVTNQSRKHRGVGAAAATRIVRGARKRRRGHDADRPRGT